MGAIRFGAPTELVLWLRDIFDVNVFVETGTNRAETAIWASANFKRVFTIEAYEPLYRQALQASGDHKNIQFLHGDSRTHMKALLSSLANPAIFWLDAHWCGEQSFGTTEECPVIGELKLLNASKVAHIVLIDDARLFLAPPPPPHKPSHWPDIATICGLLSAASTNRYVVVHDDVIVAVPGNAKAEFVEFLRAKVANNPVQPAGVSVRGTFARIRSMIGKRSNNSGT